MWYNNNNNNNNEVNMHEVKEKIKKEISVLILAMTTLKRATVTMVGLQVTTL